MTYVERLLGEQGQANRRLGEEILRQTLVEAMHTAANQPSPPRMNVYGSTCPFCCGDVPGAAACRFCRDREPAEEQSRSGWLLLEAASATASMSMTWSPSLAACGP